MTALCSVDDCDRSVLARDWCSRHYDRWRRHGHPLAGGPVRAPKHQPCIAEGCDRLAKTHGRCTSHDRSHRLATDPEYAERRRAAWRQYAADNPELIAATKRAWEEANAEVRAQMQRDRKDAHPWLASVYSYVKRRRAYGLSIDVAELVDPSVVYERDTGVCQLCFEPVDQALDFPHPQAATLDHRVPVVDPASEHTYENTQLAHWDCNRRRQAKPLAGLGAVGA